jgi:hypothetical protein
MLPVGVFTHMSKPLLILTAAALVGCSLYEFLPPPAEPGYRLEMWCDGHLLEEHIVSVPGGEAVVGEVEACSDLRIRIEAEP